jgi:4-diphosphocytidyl-2-C-methyl-D-erythritol kinase
LRPDGFHGVFTVYHAVSLYDEVTVAAAEHDSVVVTGEGADLVPADASNLAARAVAALADVASRAVRSPGTALRLSKRIPVAAGLAGGSADAAAALVAANELWRAGLSQAELCEVAADIGSDVAFALLGGTAIGVGRGERVTPALAAGAYYWVLAFAAGGLSTAQVYAAFDRIMASRDGRHATGVTQPRGPQSRGPQPPGPQPPGPVLDTRLMAALRSASAAELGPLLANDLQAAAVSLRPDLRRALAAGEEYGALGAIVSGSGPTCAYLARDAAHAAGLAVALAGAGVCRTVVAVTGPAPGANVVSVVAEPL